MALSFSDAKQIAIADYLSKLGFEPDKVRGNDYWYRSPLRHERDASFKVNTKLNLWYDHGSGEGGTLLDLGMKLHQCTLPEFVNLLEQGNFTSFSFQRQPFKEEQSKIEIIDVRKLENDELLKYLNGRLIEETVAKAYCKEVHFKISDKIFQAIGFKNNSGGFELRNSWFKGSSSPKDLTYFDNGSSRLCTFEGFIDFMALLQLKKPEIKSLSQNSDFLILNSLSFLGRSYSILKSYKENYLFLDNDTAGCKAKQRISEEGITFHDCSLYYKESKDLNDYLKKTMSHSPGVTPNKNQRL